MASFVAKSWGSRDRGLSNEFNLGPRRSVSPSNLETSPSRIPRPASTTNATRRPRQPSLSMGDALKLAAEKHLAAQGSPSPAPRPRRKDSGSSDRRPLQSMIPDKPIDLGRLGAIGARRPRTPGFKDLDAQSEAQNAAEKKADFARDMVDLQEGIRASDAELLRSMKEKKDGPFSKRRFSAASGTFANGAASRQARQASTTGLGGGIFGNGNGNGNGKRDEPRQNFADFAQSGMHPPDWLERFERDAQAAFDFRAKVAPGPGSSGEQRKTPPRKQNNDNNNIYNDMLMAGKSPVSTTRPRSTAEPAKKAFSWQVDDEFTGGDLQVSTSPPVNYGRTNTRLDEIKQAEIEAERDFSVKKPKFLERTNSKIDEIRRLEQQLGLAGGDAEPSEADSEENSVRKRPVEFEPFRRATSHFNPSSYVRTEVKPAYKDLDGEQVPNTPVTIYKNGPTENAPEALSEGQPELAEKNPTAGIQDSQELLRKLARASSKSPSPASARDKVDSMPKEQKDDAAEAAVEAAVEAIPSDKAKPKDQESKGIHSEKDVVGSGEGVNGNKTGSPHKPTVGFKGISRSSSTTSVASKQSVASYDPTARLEAEAKLFAIENLSERSSIRAPSPQTEPAPKSESDNDEEKTPQPNKFLNPATMPTPKITGAYVETPAPTKVEDRVVKPSDAKPVSGSPSHENKISAQRDSSASPRARRSEVPRATERRRPSRDSRRTKSTSRRRSPLKNSVRPPTVQEDLRQICQKNDIDDSELDDLTDLIMSSADPEKFIKILRNDDTISDEDVDDQLRRLNGMSESLRTGLAGIRTAKKGIERLEDQVSRPENQANSATNTSSEKPASPVTQSSAQQSNVFTHVNVPVPRIWRTQPKLRLTIFGWFLACVVLWYTYWIAEGLFYDKWGRQEICYRGSPCRWSPDDPDYGFVIPVKFDEWVTGGAVRPHAARWLEEAQDGWAEFHDWWTGLDIREVHHQSIRDPTKREQYWRRIEKKGLFPKWNPDPSVIPVIEAWEREAQAQEAAEARAAMGYGYNDDPDNETGSMTEDQAVPDGSTDDATVSWW